MISKKEKLNVQEMTQEQINQEFTEACCNGDLVRVKYWLTSSDLNLHAQINEPDGNRFTGLMLACIEAKFEVVKFLLTSPNLKTHADINHRKSVSFYCACSGGDINIIKYLAESKEVKENSSLHNIDMCLKEACDKNYMDIVIYLLDKGANIHYDNEECFITLCRRQNIEILKYLIFERNLEKTAQIEIIIGKRTDLNLKAMFDSRELNNKLNKQLVEKNLINNKTKV